MSKKWILAAIAVVFAGIAIYAVAKTQDHFVPSRAMLVNDQTSGDLSSVKKYIADVQAAMASNPPVMQVAGASQEQDDALAILSADSRMESYLRDKEGNPYRLEVMQNYKLPAAQAIGKLFACQSQTCYRLDIFNFTANTTLVVTVNLQIGQVMSLQSTEQQPELPARLTSIATDIAKNNPEVKKSLGKYSEPLMASTKTSLEKTVCEKSRHLCVAPTFVVSDKKSAFWVIVDLTDLKVVGTAWTKWQDKPEPVTERQLSTDAIQNTVCGKVVHAKKGDWTFDYTLTGSDGLELRNAAYKGRPVAASVKTVDWHVSYSSKDGFGYSDAIGCPIFSTAAVVPKGLPDIRTGKDGNINLTIDFEGERWPEPCNYYYRQQFQMKPDGSLRAVVANIGRGCGDDGTYRPVTRIELPADSKEFSRDGQKVDKETWWRPAECSPGDGCATLTYASGGAEYQVVPGNGQFDDGGRGDDPLLYLSSVDDNKMEGQEDLLTIGPCCNKDEHQGPDKYVNNEPLAGKPVALWYVAQIKNDGKPGEEYCWASGNVVEGEYRVSEYPCYSGPLIRRGVD